MINSNLKTQIQNRIDAVSGATSLDDLLLLRKSAENLGCNEANLDTQIGAKLSALDGLATPLQLIGASVALGLRGRVMYQTPITVTAGDELFIDALGKVKSEQYPMRGAVALADVPVATGIDGYQSAAVKGYVVGGELESSSTRGGGGAILTLSDGNLLYLFSARSSSANQLTHASVMAPNETTLISTHALTAMVNGADYSNNSWLIGAFEISANVFRVYYMTGGSGSTQAHVIRYITLTYNTGTKALSSAAGATVATSSSTSANYKTFAPQKQGERYILLGTTTSATQWCLDMQASTVIAYTGVTTLAGGTSFDTSVGGSEYAFAIAGGTPKLMRAGVDASLALPANLTSDGCFGSTWDVRLIAPRMFMSLKIGNPVKLVKFSADWLTATIYTISSLVPATLDSTAYTRALVLKSDAGRFFVKTSSTEPMLSFVWDGLSAPYGVDATVGWLSTTPVTAYFRNRLPVLLSSDRVTYAMITGQYVTDALSTYTTNMYNYFTFDAAEMTGYTPAKLGTTLIDAAANASTEFELSANASVYPTTTTPLRAEIVGKNGLRASLCRDRHAHLDSVESYASGDMTTSNYLSADRTREMQSRQNINAAQLSLAAGAAMLASARVELSVAATGSSPAGQASNSNIVVLAVEGCSYRTANVTAMSGLLSRVSAILKTDKPLFVGFGGRLGYVNWEREQ